MQRSFNNWVHSIAPKEYHEDIKSLREAAENLWAAQRLFDEATEPSLVDAAIERLAEAEKFYNQVLTQARKSHQERGSSR